MEGQKLTLITKEGKSIIVSTKFADLSEFVSKVVSDSSDTEIPVPVIDTRSMETIVKYVDSHNYQPPPVRRPITSDDPKKNLHPSDYRLLEDYLKGTEANKEDPLSVFVAMKPLVTAAEFLGMKSFQDVILCRQATEFFVRYDQESLEKLKKKFNIAGNMTPEDEQTILQEFPWIDQKIREREQHVYDTDESNSTSDATSQYIKEKV